MKERALHILSVVSITQQLNRDEAVNKICDIETYQFVGRVCGKQFVEQQRFVCERLEQLSERLEQQHEQLERQHECWGLLCEQQR